MKKYLLALILIAGIGTNVFAQTDTNTTSSGLRYYFTHKGSGPALKPGKVAIWHYGLTLTDGKKIDNSWDRGRPLGEIYPSKRIIKGTTEALSLMHIGDRGIFIMPAAIAYGEKGSRGVIPPNATLVFDMELVDIKEKALAPILDSVLYDKADTAHANPHVTEVVNTYKALAKQGLDNVYTSEDDINVIAYSLMDKHSVEALVLFKFNAKLYPTSWNIFDSLAEGYMATGNNKLAIKYYKKSLALNPANDNAVDKLKQLQAAK